MNNKDILGSVLKTAQMAQTGIRSVIKQNPGTKLENTLREQLCEYNAIEQEAYDIAETRGWKLKELSKTSKIMSDIMSRGILMYDHNDSRMAAMMIQGNTRGMIKGIKNAHRHNATDPKIEALAAKLISYENANIQQMKDYL